MRKKKNVAATVLLVAALQTAYPLVVAAIAVGLLLRPDKDLGHGDDRGIDDGREEAPTRAPTADAIGKERLEIASSCRGRRAAQDPARTYAGTDYLARLLRGTASSLRTNVCCVYCVARPLGKV